MDGLLAVYTYHEHEVYHDFGQTIEKSAVGLVDGGPTNWDNRYEESLTHFPKERLFKSFSAKIQDATASREDDRKNILNALIGRSENDESEPPKTHEKYEDLNKAVRGVFASTKAGLILASNDENKGYWNDTLNAMKHSVTKSMTNIRYLDEFKADDVADVLHHLPSGLEKLEIRECTHGRVAMDALLDWLENSSTNLKRLGIWETCIGGEVGGKECGERLARFLARDDCKIESLDLNYTDLVGSRNVDTWIECLERKNQSLKNVKFFGMVIYVEVVRESEKPNTSIDPPPSSFAKGKIYWDGTTFPDGTLSKEQEEALKGSAAKSIEDVCIIGFNYDL